MENQKTPEEYTGVKGLVRSIYQETATSFVDSNNNYVTVFPDKIEYIKTQDICTGGAKTSTGSVSATGSGNINPSAISSGRIASYLTVGDLVAIDGTRGLISLGIPSSGVVGDNSYMYMNASGIFGYHGTDTFPWFFAATKDMVFGSRTYHGGDFFIGEIDSAYLWWQYDEHKLIIAGDISISGDIESSNFEYDPFTGTLVGYKLEYYGGNAYFGGAIVSGNSFITGNTSIYGNNVTIAGQSIVNVGNVSDSTALTIPAGLLVDGTAITIANDGTISANITLSWTAETDPRFDHYQIRYKKSSFTYYQYISSNSNTITIDGLTPNTSYDFAVSSVNKYGIPSTYSSTVTYTTATSTTAPAKVSGVSAVGGIQYVIVEWTSNSEKDLSSYNVYRNTVNNSGTAILISNIRGNYLVDGNLVGGTQYFYWVKAVNTSGLVSTNFSTVVSATPRNVVGSDTVISQRGWTQTCIFSSASATQVNWGAGKFIASDGTTYNILAGNTGVMAARTYIFLDIDVSTTQYQITTVAGNAVGNNRVLIGSAINGTIEATFTIFSGDGAIKISKEGLEDGSIDLSKFSNGLTPVEVLDILPTENNFDGRMVFLTTDKKLYRYDGTQEEFTAAVPTTDLTGTIVETQIADNSISTGKIKANAITANEIAAGTITGNKIAANTIEAGNIATGTITANEIAAQTIETGNIKAGAITANEIAVGTITGNKIAAGTIEAGNIAAGTITGNEIAANTIEAGNIKAGAITTVELNFTPVQDTNVIASINASEEGIDISASKIATISAEKILIDGTTYLSNWRKSGDLTKIDGGSISTGSVTTAQLNFTPVIDGTIIASINASEEGIQISGEHIAISGSTTFSSGYDPITKVNKLGGSYASASSGARVLIFPDTNTGLQIIDDGGADVFKAIIGGTNVGDVIIGNYTGGQGIFYDKSEAKTIFKGSMIAGNITGSTITGATITGSTITGGIVQTSASGDRIIMNGSTNKIEFKNGNILYSSMYPYGGGDGSGFVIATHGSYVGTASLILFEGISTSGVLLTAISISLNGTTYLNGATVNGGNITPSTNNSYSLGTNSYRFNNVHTNAITLNGIEKTSWPTSFSGNLSDLYINTTKSWSGYGITGLGTITPYSNNSYDLGSSSYYWRNVYGINIIPSGSYTSYLGNSSYYWDYLYISSIYGPSGSNNINVRNSVNLNNYNLSNVSSLYVSYISVSSYIYCPYIGGSYGYIYFNQYGRVEVSNHFDPSGQGSYNTGGSSRYWNAVNARYFTKQGGFGSLDSGVELQDGRIVSDVEAICQMSPHPKKEMSQYGVVRIDPRTIPKIVIHKAKKDDDTLFDRDEDDRPYMINDKGEKELLDDGEDLGAMISILIGAIKELNNRLEKVENNK